MAYARQMTPAKRKRLLKKYGSCPPGYTYDDLERFLDLVYGMYSHVYTIAELRQIVVSDPFDRSETPRLLKLLDLAAWLEALLLRAFLRGWRRSQARYAQRLIERKRGYALCDYPEDDCFKTRTHQFQYNCGRLTLIDLQHDLRMLFEPLHLIRLDDFIRAHQRTLKEMPQDLEVPQYFLSVVSPDVRNPPHFPPPHARET